MPCSGHQKAQVLDIKRNSYAIGPTPCDKKCHSEQQTLFVLFRRVWELNQEKCTLLHTPLICLLIALRFYRIYSCCLGQISSLSLPYLCCNGSLMVKYCHHKTKQHEHAMSLRCSQLTPSYPSVQLQEPSTTLQVPLFWQVHCPAHPRPKVPSEHSVKQIAQKLPLITLLCLQSMQFKYSQT